MRKLFTVLVLGLAFTMNAQDKKETPKDGWKRGGNITLLGNQSAFSNWVAGGNNSVAATLGLNYDFNLLKGDWSWDNKIIAQYGLSHTQGTGRRKTDDLFEFNSLVGKKAEGYWSYSFFLNLRSQFTNGYDYTGGVEGPKTSSFFSPGYLTFGPGLLWKKSDNFKINIAPATSKMTFVSNEFAGAYGTDPGETFLYQLGFYGSLYHKTDIMENVSLENIVSVFSNYLEKPQNVDITHQLNLVMKINKYLSTNLSLHTIIDDDASSRVQFKEVFGLGASYRF
ncbi:DUF3078 domain-containing protein [Tenacibaculum maritimum]|uniref:DUF3078 domain-containing protein n=1 Tax=Tenacibaculum maritimum TaxID=107401 RepID=UPI0010A379F6|nr:DUF3078 domain-containing protein [Tenacibaculum maritimum]MCD9562867.1 DUF3078 domain-containing protein [Tenacibaculum maritimum]MCD9564568.1 DUF3078 domain-containing protein [Tenacibaculum maritimum]MCD9578297.1 DUF3078 domain-containing protein [Tenacibaculum maritimum]MCD9586049.1 DUF3078 domain-containing protein [Tenacibaculum maritimum]MCD9595476.1 DUF3078 domain-containing protein [Tenacibaculum maritimum]